MLSIGPIESWSEPYNFYPVGQIRGSKSSTQTSTGDSMRLYGKNMSDKFYRMQGFKGCICFDLDGALVPHNYAKHKKFYKEVHNKLNDKIGKYIDEGFLFAIITNSQRHVNSEQVRKELESFTSFNKQIIDGDRGVIFFSREPSHMPDSHNIEESSTIVSDTIGPAVKRYNINNREGSTYKTAAMLELSKNFAIRHSNIILMDDIPEWMCATSAGIGCGNFKGYVVPKKSTTDETYIDERDLDKAIQIVS